MPKICLTNNCQNPVFSNLFCLRHKTSRTDDKWLKSSKGKITPKVKDNSLKPITSKRIKQVSDKQLVRLAEYRVVRDKYFKDNPVCEFKDCYSTEVTLHHKMGRIGDLLTDIRYFCSLCLQHHQFIEVHPKLAKELGLSVDRLTGK